MLSEAANLCATCIAVTFRGHALSLHFCKLNFSYYLLILMGCGLFLQLVLAVADYVWVATEEGKGEVINSFLDKSELAPCLPLSLKVR